MTTSVTPTPDVSTPPDGDTFEAIGHGLAVFEQEELVEGVARWLDSPDDVMDFVLQDDVENTIVIARGGTTTFLTPALTAGVKGIVTLQGAPESHLGIVSREYAIPCVMGTRFTVGVATDRGEIVPADGARIRLDTRSSDGVILAAAGSAGDQHEVTSPSAPQADAEAEAQAAMIQELLANYRREVPHGPAGDRQIRDGLTTGVMELTPDSLHRPLTVTEYNDWSTYAGWHMWDCLSQRVTEGESGLIPRQEYESVAFVQVWKRYPEFQKLITERVGVDGVVEIGASARREVGTKVNLLHNWAMTWAIAFGRGVALDLGLAQPAERTDDLREALQFGRRLYAGMWGGGGMLASMRNYRCELVEQDLLDRFYAERTVIEAPEQRDRMQRLNASAEVLGFLMHFDNRCGMADSGPYPTPDGGFMILRDHFIGESAFSWSDAADGLPYAITQAMYFKPSVDLDVKVLDLSTLFTKPANYLPHMTAMTVYARDKWDTPMSQLRLVKDEEMEAITSHATDASKRLYRRIASMSRRERIMAGVNVYYTTFILPFARKAGVWDELVRDFDFHELDPVTSDAYYRLTRNGTAQELIPRLFITGTGYQPIPE